MKCSSNRVDEKGELFIAKNYEFFFKSPIVFFDRILHLATSSIHVVHVRILAVVVVVVVVVVAAAALVFDVVAVVLDWGPTCCCCCCCCRGTNICLNLKS